MKKLPLIFLILAVEVVIWLRDRKGIHVNLEGQGHLAEAADLFEIIVSHRGLPKDAHNIFSLWLVSPLLGLYRIFL